jgi:hypothetical protein
MKTTVLLDLALSLLIKNEDTSSMQVKTVIEKVIRLMDEFSKKAQET